MMLKFQVEDAQSFRVHESPNFELVGHGDNFDGARGYATRVGTGEQYRVWGKPDNRPMSDRTLFCQRVGEPRVHRCKLI